LNLFYIYIYIKTEKFTSPNKVLLILGRKIGAHHEDCRISDVMVRHACLECSRSWVRGLVELNQRL